MCTARVGIQCINRCPRYQGIQVSLLRSSVVCPMQPHTELKYGYMHYSGIQLNKEGTCENMVQHLHDVYGHMVIRSLIYSQPV